AQGRVERVLEADVWRGELIDHGRVEVLAPELREPAANDRLVLFDGHGCLLFQSGALGEERQSRPRCEVPDHTAGVSPWPGARWPSRSKIMLSSAGPSIAANACGVIVANSAASPVSTVISRSPRRRRTRPSSTKNQSRPGWTRCSGRRRTGSSRILMAI